MTLSRDSVELLAPARTADIGREAILHGADAVYIGGPGFGARHQANNSVADIAELVRFARPYHARIFVTLNTILHDSELDAARTQIYQLYDAGVDALIIQDMGLLRIDLPPIELHASTQCDIRTPEKARFLADCGLSQLVLARELSLPEVRAIRSAVSSEVLLEYFIHGALCVAFSGLCNISHAHTGRSANRGDCSQACRLPYTLRDAKGGVVAFEKHLLSMKDNNQSDNLEALLDAGIRSLKIEGRYKDMSYVKNITAHYRRLLDAIFERRGEWRASSSGRSVCTFQPDPERTFHRGRTDYFTRGRQMDIGAFDTPKFVGVALGEVVALHDDSFDMNATAALCNGDGLNFMHKREVIGVQANTVKEIRRGRWRVWPNERMALLREQGLRVGVGISRNRDQAWEQALLKPSAERRMGVVLTLRDTAEGLAVRLRDEDGVTVDVALACDKQIPKDAERAARVLREQLGKLGKTCFALQQFELQTAQAWFVPVSALNALRRQAVDALLQARLMAYVRPQRRLAVEPPAVYPDSSLSFLANVYNAEARAFYHEHGVQLIAAAYEAHEEAGEVSLMVTKHCLRFAFNLCPKQAKGVQGVMGQIRADPMTLSAGKETFTLRFECRPCEMHVMGKMKKHILKQPPPTTVPIVFYR